MLHENKQALTLGQPRFNKVIFAGREILVKDVLSLEDMAVLMGVYMEEYFSDSPTHIIEAEYRLALALLNEVTNVQVDENTIKIILHEFQQWKAVKDSIKNYSEFRSLLQRTVDEKKEQIRLNEGLGRMLGSLYTNFQTLLVNLAQEDITPEKIGLVKEMVAEINKSDILKSAVKIFGAPTE